MVFVTINSVKFILILLAFHLLLAGIHKPLMNDSSFSQLNNEAHHTHEMHFEDILALLVFGDIEHDHSHESDHDEANHQHSHRHALGLVHLPDFVPSNFYFSFSEFQPQWESNSSLLLINHYIFEILRPPISA